LQDNEKGTNQSADRDGHPQGGLDEDCDVDLDDFATFPIDYTGPLL
jgi:hypothetical protein